MFHQINSIRNPPSKKYKGLKVWNGPTSNGLIMVGGFWIGTPVSPCVIVRPLGFCAYLYPNIGLLIGFAEIDIYDGRLHQTLQTTGAPDAYGIQETNQTNIALTFF